ncbi:MAG TPA: hypothetical protein VLW17_04265 [Thermoanaerobaculaceae bacterium]|nr:hypothetical protein [Thermoanaerobaculaceae bacterium]
MRKWRSVVAVVVLFVVALAWNALVHLVVLRSSHDAVRHLLRADLAGKLWLSLAGTAATLALFVWGYRRFACDRSLGEGLRYGLFFGVIAGLLVDLNQYVLYPIPAWVAASWFAGGLAEFLLYGALLTRLIPPQAGRGMVVGRD